MNKVVIIGGVAGGATAAARVRRNSESAQIVMIERGPYISFANCGLPYHLSGAIAEREQLLVTSEEAFETRYNVVVRSRTEALSIDRRAKTVRLRNLANGEEYDEPYDRLLLSPGAEPVRPHLQGIESKRIFTLRNLPDLDRIMAHLQTEAPRRAVVVGGGFIGIEVAENLHERGLSTTLVEGADQILAPLDYEMAAMLHAHVRDKKVALHLSDKIERFEDQTDHTVVHLASGKRLHADIIVLAIGVRPETKLARAADLEIGTSGGIRVNKHLQTSDPNIYAVGDAIEITQTLHGKPALIPLAGPANRQGRIAADNITFGNTQSYRGTQGTSILKVFDLAAASTGLNEKQLQANDLPYHSAIIHSASHASYYPGAQQLTLKLLFSPEGRVYGAQAVGGEGVDKRIDVIATAIHGDLNVRDLAELELAYAPPFGSAKDPVNVIGYVASNILDGSLHSIDWRTLRALDPREIQLVDVRTAAERELGTIPGSRHIELDTLRARLGELDPKRPAVLFCQIGLRGYLASRILLQAGFVYVRNLSGGYRTYACAAGEQRNPNIFDRAALQLHHANDITVEHDNTCAIALSTKPPMHRLNAVGLQCPGPIMKTYRAMEALTPGDLLEVTVSDPAFSRDIRAWSSKTGHEVVSIDSAEGLTTAVLRKNAGLPAPGTAAHLTQPAREKTTLVVFSADLDKVMASLIIANGALAMGKPVSVFFTFWGLNVLRRSDAPALAKPLMDRVFGMMMPAGVSRLNSISKMNFAGLGAKLIRKIMGDKQVDDAASLLRNLIEGGAQLIACQMSMDVMGIRREELVGGVEIGGVAAFLGEAQESATTLFI